MSIPLHPPRAPARRIARRRARCTAAGSAARVAWPGAFGAATARALVVVLGLALGGGTGAIGCARPDELSLSPEVLDRDRAAREVVLAEIERDHEVLASLIASDRFEEPEAIYSDPELREVALHLVEQSRKLRRLAESDVLPPGVP